MRESRARQSVREERNAWKGSKLEAGLLHLNSLACGRQPAAYDRASRAASFTASNMLVGLAFPRQAISNAVPWSTDVRIIGKPRVTFTPRSKASILRGIRPWSWYMQI